MRRLRFATFLAPSLWPVYQSIADYVGQQLGCPTTLVVGESFTAFAEGQADVGFICGLPYVQLTRLPPGPVELLAAPVLQGARYAGTRAANEVRDLLRDSSAPRTTRISRAYLEAAAQGLAIEPWHAFVRCLGSGDDALRATARALLRVGETSGADALTGFCWALNRAAA